MKYIGRQINVGFWKETTRWTAVAPSIWYPKTNLDFDEKIETAIDESSIGTKVKGMDLDVIKRTGEWSIEGLARVNSIWLLLLNVLWKVTTTELDPNNAYNHKLEIDNVNTSPSLSIWIQEPNGDYNFPLAMISSITISAKIWEYISISMDFKSKKWETANHTVVYDDKDYKFSARHSLFKMATDLAGLSGATGSCIEMFEITIAKTMEETFCLNSGIDLGDLIDWTYEITWSIVAVFDDETTYKNVALAGDYRAMQMKLADTNIDLGAGNNPTIDITLPKVAFTDYGREKGNDWTVKQNLWFVALNDIVSGKAIEINVVNSITSY